MRRIDDTPRTRLYAVVAFSAFVLACSPVAYWLSSVDKYAVDHDAIAARVSAWLDDTDRDAGDRLVIMHGISSRVLRGVMTGIDTHPEYAAPIAGGLPQGSVVRIVGGAETVVHTGTGTAPA